MIFETIKLALQAIRRNALRSFLTLLGIVIGVGAVIAMVTIGNGTTARVEQEMSKLGTNLLFVFPGQMGRRRSSTEAKPFTDQDITALREQLRNVEAVAPASTASKTVIYGAESRTVSVVGTDNAYLTTQARDLAGGRAFLASELRGGQAVCLIGETVREKLFGSLDPVGAKIRVDKLSCDIVGLLAAKGQSGFGQDQDDLVLIPIRTFQRRIAGNTDIARIYVSASDKSVGAKVQGDIEWLLRERRKISPTADDDFTVADTQQIVATQTATTTMLTALLGAVAGVSLLVGGIGIMNIMLVSVTERTREIGIRLAIGATEQQVLMQFLVEAVVLALVGGIAGILLGLGLAGGASMTMNIPFILDQHIVLLAFGFSALVGVVFGYFPARRAAHLNPIEALRHE